MKKILLFLFLIFSIPALGAVKFDGVDDIFNCGVPSDDIFAENRAITISAWIKPISLGESSAGRILVRATGTAGPIFAVFTANVIVFQINGTTNLIRQSNANAFILNKWQHVCVTWDGSTTAANIHFYVNGVETTYGTTQDGYLLSDNSTQSIYIGNNSDTSRTFDGQISQLKIWNVQLSDNEIKNEASQKMFTTNQTRPSALVRDWWKNDYADGSTATKGLIDHSPSHNTCTPSNGPTGKADNNLTYP